MRYILLLLLLFTSEIFAIELQEVAGYQIGKWESSANVTNPSVSEVIAAKATYENVVSPDGKTLEIKGKIIINNHSTSYTYSISLQRNKAKLYEYKYWNDTGLNLSGTIQVLSDLSTKMIDDKSKETSLAEYIKIDAVTNTFKIAFFNADGTPKYSLEGKSKQSK